MRNSNLPASNKKYYSNFIISYNSTIYNIDYLDVEDKDLRFREHLMLKLLDIIRQNDLSAHEATKKFQTNPLTVINLLQRKIGLLNTNELLNMLTHSGYIVYSKS